MGKTQINIQDNFLYQIRKENVSVIIYLVNGFQLRGLVKGFDNFTILLESEGKIQLVYKHAVTTITPTKYVKLMNVFDGTTSETQPQQETSAPVSEQAEEV